MNIFKDSKCEQQVQTRGLPHTTSLKQLKNISGDDNQLFYKQQDHCFPITLSEEGFHLKHMDEFFKCEHDNASIVECMRGKEAESRYKTPDNMLFSIWRRAQIH